MAKVAIAGWGYNGGQVIFKFQKDRDDRINPTIYEQVAEDCTCCCLPPARVKISLHPGLCVTGISPGDGFTADQRAVYSSQVGAAVEKKLSLTLDNIPCPRRSGWTYYYTFQVDGSTQPCTIYLEVPRCSDYPREMILVCANGDIDDALRKKFPNVRPPDMRLPLDDIDFGPPAFLDLFGFRGFDDKDGSSGEPAIGMCIENICKLYDVNQRQFKIPCYVYEELGSVATVKNGVVIPTQSVYDWNVWAPSDGYDGGPLAYFDVEFVGDQPLP
jgi:hypothetical protein